MTTRMVIVAMVLAASLAEAQGRKVSGTVVDAAYNTPVTGATVQYQEGGRVQSTGTDSKGYFEFDSGTLGVVTVSARDYGTAYMRWPPFAGSSLRVLLREPKAVSGLVTDMATRRPVGYATVTVFATSVNRSIVSDTATTERNGEFRFQDLPASSDQVAYIAFAQGFAPRFGLFTLAKGTTNLPVGLLLDALVEGSVVDGRGSPVEGAVVTAQYSADTNGGDLLGNLVGGRIQTDAEGVFGLDGIAPDEAVTLQAEFDGRTSNAVTVMVAPGTVQTGIVLRLQ